MRHSGFQSGGLGVFPILAVVALVAVLAGALWWQSREDTGQPQPLSKPPTATVQSAPAPIAQEPLKTALRAETSAYLAWAQSPAPADLPRGHDYTSEGLRKLAAALDAAGGTPSGSDRGQRLKAAADELEKDPESLRHADVAREAFVEASKWVAEVQSRSGARPSSVQSGGEQNALDAAAAAIDPRVPLRKQREQVARFFELAAAALSSRPDPA